MRMQVTLSLALRYLQRIKGGNVWEPQLMKWMSIVKRVSPLKRGCPHDVLRQTVNVSDTYETHCSTHLHMQLHAQIGSNGVGKEKTGGHHGAPWHLYLPVYLFMSTSTGMKISQSFRTEGPYQSRTQVGTRKTSPKRGPQFNSHRVSRGPAPTHAYTCFQEHLLFWKRHGKTG